MTCECMAFSNRQEAMDEAAKIKRALLAHGTERLSDSARFVSNGELTTFAEGLAIHGKTAAMGIPARALGL